jgi:hypothetical protein
MPAALSPQEVPPALRGAPRRGRDSRSVQELPHGARPDLDREPGQLSLHPSVAPGRVLLGQAEDQLSNPAVQRRTTRTPASIGPPSCDGVPVPSTHRLRAHEQGRPSFLGQEPIQRRQQSPIRRPVSRPGDVAVEHGELVSQDQQLDLVRAGATAPRYDQFEEATQRPIEEGHHHARILPQPQRSPLVGEPKGRCDLILGTHRVDADLGIFSFKKAGKESVGERSGRRTYPACGWRCPLVWKPHPAPLSQRPREHRV